MQNFPFGIILHVTKVLNDHPAPSPRRCETFSLIRLILTPVFTSKQSAAASLEAPHSFLDFN